MKSADCQKAASLLRHGKFEELEGLLNQSDWNLPIDYADDQGNTLLHIAAQNGNKRMAKLCLRYGAHIDAINRNGQTCLHFAFGYGYDSLGQYLIEKGANDSVQNVFGLTCYEGISEETIKHL